MPRARARERMATLWSLLPVKWCSIDGKRESSTSRRSACTPLSRRTESLRSPRAMTSTTPGSPAKWPATSPGASVLRTMSTSSTTSR